MRSWICLFEDDTNWGDFTGSNFENVFKNLDRQANYNLSQSRYKKDRRQWAQNDALNSLLKEIFYVRAHVHNHMVHMAS